jgi:predicted permease
MRPLRAWLLRLRGVFRANRDGEFAEEIEAHLEMHVRDLIESGLTPDEARRQAIMKLGGVESTRQTYRDMEQLPWVESMLRDCRFTFRTLAKNPGFTVVALAALTLGIGASTAVFSVVESVLLRPLPYSDPDRLVWIHDGLTQGGKSGWSACMEDFLLWQARARSFAQLAAFTGDHFALTGNGQAEELGGVDVTARFFDTLGVRPLIGRTFAADADQPGRERTALISEHLWRSRYAARTDILGRSIVLDGQAVAVIGVMPSTFRFVFPDADVWRILPLTPPTRRGPFILRGIARLKPGVTLAEVNAEMAGLAQGVERADPRGLERLRYPVVGLTEAIVGDVRPLLIAVAGAVALVLLIAIFNVGNLLLARAAAREQEIAIRLSIGAGRKRLIQQLLTESIVLALAGGGIGVFFAYICTRLLRVSPPPGIPRLETLSIDGRVLLFTLLVCILSGVAFGLVPAIGATRPNLSMVLQEAGRGGGEGPRRRRLRNALVVAEIALAVILLAGAGLLIRSFLSLGEVPIGFGARADHLLTMQISPSADSYGQQQRLAIYWGEVIREVRSLPGVESAALSIWLPPDHAAMSDSFEIQGKTPPDGGPVVPVPIVSNGYFSALQILLLRGRSFDGRDTPTSPPVTIISENLARRYFPGEDPIGKRLKHGGPESNNPYMEIVGVVSDLKYEGAGSPDEPVYYESSSQVPDRPMWLVVRTHDDPHGLIPTIRNRIAALDGNVPVSHIESMDESMYASVALPRFRSILMGVFGLIALLLAAIGIYGVMTYSVLQRTQELAIRIALGATRWNVIGRVVGHGIFLALCGITIGSVGALGFVRTLRSMLFDVSPSDPAIFSGAALLLFAVAVAASYIPAVRAASKDPLRALRRE